MRRAMFVSIVAALVLASVLFVLWHNHSEDQRRKHDFYCAISEDSGYKPPGCP